MENIMTFEEIKRTPYHYTRQILESTEYSYLLFNYGPYLILNDQEIVIRYARDIKMPEVKLLAAHAAFINILKNNNYKVRDLKRSIRNAIEVFATDEFPQIEKVGNQLIENVRRYQVETKSLESTILNCTPIVQYRMDFLRKQNETSASLLDMNNITKEKLLKCIIEIFTNHTDDILYHSESFIDSMSTETLMNYFDAYKHHELMLEDVYFLFVYMLYCVEDLQTFIMDINNIKLNYNKISNGLRADISSTVNSIFNVIS